ncbi:hypothetical protein QAD02_005518 [Eretmocerus hayati]|uniref:Uncharacterized protein n=1 Tax=Eretmocerus hayati TaxID=131215 RepID=A0ACC2NSY4_9HYME|nr:hypothetical protein QAD02_005518 [Eretmocerus hayati]
MAASVAEAAKVALSQKQTLIASPFDEGPLVQPLEPVSTLTLLLVCSLGALLFLVAMGWIFCRRRWREHVKLGGGTGPEKPLSFRPPQRKPTAVKSPGSQGHYLKKSPSPTGPAKSPPGVHSPTGAPGPVRPNGLGHHLPSSQGHHRSSSFSAARSPQGGSPSGVSSPVSEAQLSIENERDKAEVEASEKLASSSNGSVKLQRPLESTDTASASTGSLGQLVFRLRYLGEQNALVVSVVRCKGLPARGQHGASSDPYVKLQLLPDKQHRTKTRVLRNTRDPVYDEDFTFFGISLAQLKEISLHFVVMSFDRYSRDDVIGEVICALSSVPNLGVAQNQPMTLCQEIHPRSLKIQSQGRGELLVSLCWQPATSKLTVVVLKARNLPKMDVTGLADPFVKIYLHYNNQRIAKRKTHVKKRTLNPVFNESIVFEIPNGAEGLGKVSLEFALLDWDRVTKNEVIGRLEIGGPKCQGSALSHWNEVCSSPKRQIADWHKLRE